MNNKNENSQMTGKPSLWALQSKDARKQILNQYINKYSNRERKLSNLNEMEHLRNENLNSGEESLQSIQFQKNDQEDNKTPNVIILNDFLKYLSMAYLGSNKLDSYGINWSNMQYCEQFANLLDVSVNDILQVFKENPLNKKEEIEYSENFENNYFQTPSCPEIPESSMSSTSFGKSRNDQSLFSIKVELSLKSNDTSHETHVQSKKISSDIKNVINGSINNNGNSSKRLEDLKKSAMQDKIPIKSGTEQVFQNRQVNSLGSKAFEKLKSIQSAIIVSTVEFQSQRSSNPELNKNKEGSLSSKKRSQKQNNLNELDVEKILQKNALMTEDERKLEHNFPSSSCSDDIEISVSNDNEVTKYRLPENLLISKMGYFAQVSSTKQLKDFKITIHSNPEIFEWIISWVDADFYKLKGSKPLLTCQNVIPVLISASMLQIAPLIELCLNFCLNNLNDIIECSEDLVSLDEGIISRLASMFSNVTLSRVNDESDKILTRLYCEMIISLVQSKPQPWRGHFITFPLVFKCSICQQLILKAHSGYISCLPEQTRINYRGDVFAIHQIDPNWNITKYIKNMMKKCGTWEKVYWNMWAECHFLKCSECNEFYSLKFAKGCRTHVKKPVFKSLNNLLLSPEGIYPCCGSKAYRFDISALQKKKGCRKINHTPLLEFNKCYRDIEKIHKIIKPVLLTDKENKQFDKDKRNSTEEGTDSKLKGTFRSNPSKFSPLLSQSDNVSLGLMDEHLQKMKDYKRFPIKGWKDCQAPLEDKSCKRFSSDESVKESFLCRRDPAALCSESSRNLADKNALVPEGNLDEENKDSDASLLDADESKPQEGMTVQEYDFQSILNIARISINSVEKIEKKLKESLNEIKIGSSRLNQDNLRDYEDKLMGEMSSMLCQRTESVRACVLDKFSHINFDTIMKTGKTNNVDKESGDKARSCHSNISIGNSVKTYCSTLGSSTRIYHSRTSKVWNSFIPLSGTFVRVEAEWQDTFNAKLPLKAKTGKKQDNCGFINSPNFASPSVLENKREIGKRRVTKSKSVSGKSCSTIRKSWETTAPNSKISEIESYLSITVFPKKPQLLTNNMNIGASKMDQQLMIPPCEGKQNLAFTCGYTSIVNNDLINVKNNRESEYINQIWMYDVRYKELDYLSCTYMPIPQHKDYDVVKGVDWQKLRGLESEWKNFLKLMKIDEHFKRYFHHSPIKQNHYQANLMDKNRKMT